MVVVAEHGNGTHWLWKICQEDLDSGIVKRQARALILLGFSTASPASGILEKYSGHKPMCWLTEVARKALEHWRHNAWAQHWYRQFTTVEDDVEAWAAFRLLLRCADRRFWLWQTPFEKLPRESSGFMRRRAFFENNRDTLKNRIKKNEELFSKSFLGTRILSGEMHPWLE